MFVSENESKNESESESDEDEEAVDDPDDPPLPVDLILETIENVVPGVGEMPIDSIDEIIEKVVSGEIVFRGAYGVGRSSQWF